MAKTTQGLMRTTTLTTILLGISSHAAANTQYVDFGNVCGSNTPCHITIQAAVNAASLPADIRIYPGTYNENVDLSLVNGSSPGTIGLQALTAGGVPGVGTVVINALDVNSPAMTTSAMITGDLEAHGLILQSTNKSGMDVEFDGNVTLTGITASDTGGDGIDVYLGDNGGEFTASNVTASNNSNHGIDVYVGDIAGTNYTFNLTSIVANDNGVNGLHLGDDDSSVTNMVVNISLTQITANNNGGHDGILARATNGTARATGITANSSFTTDGLDIEDANRVFLSNVMAENSSGDGVEVEARLLLEANNIVVSGNGQGISLQGWNMNGSGTETLGDVLMWGIEASSNNHGISIDEATASSDIVIASSNIFGNTTTGMRIEETSAADTRVNAGQNWWGDPSGPTHPSKNPGGAGDVAADSSNVVDNSTGSINFGQVLSAPVDDVSAVQRPVSTVTAVPVMTPLGLALLVIMLGLVAGFRGRLT